MIFVFIDTLSLLVVKAAGIWKMPATKEILRISLQSMIPYMKWLGTKQGMERHSRDC